ncbi:MAG: SulP family inorganic anion transporter, partial [Gammaproteobacteria bacterium]|nr:SulP family inorganic anion transporter [Gammaproteobacteria bacterium]
FQAMIGLTGGGKLIKFIPYPVVYGFITGSAILMVKSQLSPLQGGGVAEMDLPWIAIPVVTALVTFAGMQWLPRWLTAIPGSVSGLLVGTIVFHILIAIGPGTAPDAWVVGTLPGPGSLKIGISTAGLDGLPWGIVLSSALALAVLASIDALLTSVVADVQTGERHKARRELIGQGIGQVVSGLLGGMTGSGTTGATVVAINSGGRYLVGVATGIVFVLLILFMGPVGQWLPISALAGIILHVALIGMLEKD